MNEFYKILSENKNNISILIGNGFNLHYVGSKKWEELVLAIWNKHQADRAMESLPKNASLLELAEMCAGGCTSIHDTASEIIKNIEKISQMSPLIKFAVNNNIPLLTTNYDLNIEYMVGAQAYHFGEECSKEECNTLDDELKKLLENDFKWSEYYACKKIEDPLSEFAIWHVHGDINSPTTIRISSSDYFDAIEHTIDITKGLGCIYSFCTDFISNPKTWVNIFINKPLCVIGLALEKEEYFLRWLFIRKYRHYKQRKNREPKGWYIHCKKDKELSNAQKAFLSHVGLKIVTVKDYSEIYDFQQKDMTWKLLLADYFNKLKLKIKDLVCAMCDRNN